MSFCDIKKEMDIYLVFSTISNEHLIKSCKLYEQKPFLTNEVSCPVQDLRVETVRRRPGMQEVLPSRECTTHFRLPLFILLATSPRTAQHLKYTSLENEVETLIS